MPASNSDGERILSARDVYLLGALSLSFSLSLSLSLSFSRALNIAATENNQSHSNIDHDQFSTSHIAFPHDGLDLPNTHDLLGGR